MSPTSTSRNLDVPDLDVPNLNVPNVNVPNVNLPNVNVPGIPGNVNVPNVNLPNVNVDVPDVADIVPDFNVPDIADIVPDFNSRKSMSRSQRPEREWRWPWWRWPAVAVAVAVVGRRGQPRNGSTRSEHGGFAQWVNRKARKSRLILLSFALSVIASDNGSSYPIVKESGHVAQCPSGPSRGCRCDRYRRSRRCDVLAAAPSALADPLPIAPPVTWRR